MKSILIANWKMYLNLTQSVELAKELKKKNLPPDKEIVLCPTFLAIPAVSEVLKNSSLSLGAQNVFWEEHGPYTGEVSAATLKHLGCQYVIVGHSERRQYLTENNEMVHKKVKAALAAGLTPIVCVGETESERDEGRKDYVLISQISEILSGIILNVNHRLVIAYEPVWAISAGGGIAADPSEVQYANDVVWHALFDFFERDIVKNNISIIYGGSVKPENVASYSGLPNVQGLLVGSASLEADKFFDVVAKA